MNIHKMLAVAAIVAGVGAYAATPVAIWDGDFTTLTKGTFTLSENGNTRTDNYLQISGDNGILVTSTDALNVFTVLVRCEGLNLASANNQVLFTSYGAANAPHDNKTGVHLPANNAVCRGIWEGVDWNNGATQGSVPSNYTTLIYNHQQTNGTYAYALAPASDSDNTVVRTTLYSVVGLRSSGTTYKGFAIGGLRGTTSETLLPATGLKITGIAVFNSTLTEAEMTGYTWPSFVTPGYEDFGLTAGIVLWRGTQNTFYNSTVIDVDKYGVEGTPYAMKADNSSTSWQRFANGQAAYVSPGKVLVYDSPGTGQGYKYNSNADFTPISFGGMWVKTLAINGLPFSIVGDSANRRFTEFGARGKSTLFRFDKSFTINRTSKTTFYGNATVEIAENATFTAQEASNYNVEVDSAATLTLKGAGTLAVTTMKVAGTLDISATPVPTITGNVTIDGGATLVVPAGTELDKDITVQVCSGTLTSDGPINVKVGDNEPVAALLWIDSGTITKIETDLEYELTLNGTATNWSTGNWTRNGQSVSAPKLSNVIITASESTELTVDANVNLSSLTVRSGPNIVVKVKIADNASLYSNIATIESGVFQQSSAAVLGATPEIVVKDGASFDLNGLAINGTNAISVKGAGAGNWPWALTSSSGEVQLSTPPTLTGDATIGGAGKIVLGANQSATEFPLGGFTLTKSSAGELYCYNVRTDNGTLDIAGGTVSFNQWTALDGSETIDRHTTVTVRNGAELKNNAARRLWIDTLNVESGATVTTTDSGFFGISTAFTGTCSTEKLQFNDGAVATLSGDLSVTTLVAAGDNNNSAVGEITFGLASGTSAANVIVSAETTTVGSITLGAGVKLNLKSGTGTLDVATSLDISTASLPFVTGNVTITAGATLVVPEGTKLNTSITIPVCSGTLTASDVYVKVGDDEPNKSILHIDNGTITKIETLTFATQGYEPFGETAGIVLWRGTEDIFPSSTVIDVDRNGNLGEPYQMKSDQSSTSWQRFASNMSAYTSPGKVLVYDSPGTGEGYKYNVDANFAPLSFGGMWVKTLAINGSPFSITGSGTRNTELGASGKTTLFKFDASYTIARTGTTTFYGDATVDIAEGAIFRAQTNASHVVEVDAAATLSLIGVGTLAVTTMNVAGTLDISATSVPNITGNVTVESGATLVFPKGTVVDKTTSIKVCSEKLTCDGIIYVKVGDEEAKEAILRINGGTIDMIETNFARERTFYQDYPNLVPAGFTYIYEATEETPATISAVTVKGTLITKGPITITNLEIAEGTDFVVAAGNTTVNCSADCKLMGNITVDAGATLTNTRTDSLSYNHAMTVDIYGTLAMGNTRWSIPGNCTFNVHAGATVTGEGDALASLDFIDGTSTGLDVYGGEGEGSVTIEGKMRVRKNKSRIWIAENTTLVLGTGIVDGSGSEVGGFKQVGAGTLEIHANNSGLSGNTSVMTDGTVRLVDTTVAFPIDLQGNSALEIVATDNITTVPVDVTIANDNVTFSGDGKADGKIIKTSAPGGDLATFLQSEKWEGTFVADWKGGAGTRFDINSFGNANSVVKVTQLAGGYASDGSENFVVVPTVNVSGTMTLNGYSTTTTLTKLTGSGIFTSQTYTINVTTLDNFTGTLAPNVNMTIGTINLTSTPQIGDKVVTLGSNAKIANISATKVSIDGVVDDSLGLEVKSGGIYVTDATVEYVARVGDVDYYDSLVDALGEADEGDIITLLADVDDTIAIADGITITGDKTISGGVLQIVSGTTLTLDGTLAVTSAIEFVGDNAKLVVGPGVTGVTAESMGCAEGFYGAITPAQNTPETGWTTYTAATIMTEVEVTPGNATVTGVKTGSYACGTTIEFSVEPNENFKVVSVTANGVEVVPEEGTYSVTVREDAIAIVVTTADAPKMIQVTVTAENATVTNQDTSEPLESGTYEEGTELKFTVAANEGFTLVSVTTNSVEVVPAEDIYSVTVGNEAIEILVTTEEKSSSDDTYEITDKTVLDENGSFEVSNGTATIKLGDYDVTEGFTIEGGKEDATWTAKLKEPVLSESTSGEGDQFVVGDGDTVTLNVAMVKGLYYGVGASTSLTIARPTPLTQYTGETGVAPLSATKPEGATGFFKVFVDIKP